MSVIDDYGESVNLFLAGETRSSRRKPVLMPICPL